jgi:hypothetical protein
MEETDFPIIGRYREGGPCAWNRRQQEVSPIHRASIHKAYTLSCAHAFPIPGAFDGDKIRDKS